MLLKYNQIYKATDEVFLKHPNGKFYDDNNFALSAIRDNYFSVLSANKILHSNIKDPKSNILPWITERYIIVCKNIVFTLGMQTGVIKSRDGDGNINVKIDENISDATSSAECQPRIALYFNEDCRLIWLLKKPIDYYFEIFVPESNDK